MIGNKIVNRITNVWKNSKQNNSETVTSEHDTEIPKQRYICPDKWQEVIGYLSLKQ